MLLLLMFLIAVIEDRLSVPAPSMALRMAKASTVNMEEKEGKSPFQMVEPFPSTIANEVPTVVLDPSVNRKFHPSCINLWAKSEKKLCTCRC